MSASQPPNPPPPPGGVPAADPSMEDILASIRRILNEDEQPPASPDGQPPPSQVLELSEDMLVADTAPTPPVPFSAPSPATSADHEPEPPAAPVMVPPDALLIGAGLQPVAVPPAKPPGIAPMPSPARDQLMAPDSAAAAASSVGMLLRTLMSEREQVHVYRGGPTIEDLVREEVRALLKDWLDANLPPLVERLVRAEIERVVGRATT